MRPAIAHEEIGAVSLAGVRVLVVDDSATNRRILIHQMTSWGMIVDDTGSPRQSLELLHSAQAQSEPYDIAILDLMMPEMDGFELAAGIKADPAIAAVALVLLPSTAERGHGDAARKASIAAYLQKPVRQSQLYDCLITVMAQLSGDTESAKPGLVTRHSLRESGPRSSQQKVFSTARILIAEDNLINQRVALGQLRNLGYHARAVGNGRAVLEAFAKDEFDIILMDCQMPELDGFETTREIRRQEGATRRTTIIAMTANALEGDSEKCLAAGMDDYLSKPVKSEVLQQKLQQWLKPASVAPARRQLNFAETSGKTSVPEVISLDVLEALKKLQQPNEPDFVTELIDLFLNDTASQIEFLRAAVASNNAPEVRRLAHLMKGSSANIGAGRLAEFYEELETRDLDLRTTGSDGQTLMRKLDDEFREVTEAFRVQRREPATVGR